MASKFNIKFFLSASLALLIISVSFIIITFTHLPTNNSTILDSVEVAEYKGQKLSSSDNFIENSIHGPQNGNLETYQLNMTGLVKSQISSSYDEVIKHNEHYMKVVTLHCIEG